MNLMDCFNVFQKVSKALRLSPNARSLYIAILGEFNSARYPEALDIPNALLRHLSGINLDGKSDSSFQSARNALQNAGLIKHKNQVYKLTPDVAQEKLSQYFQKLLETPCTQLRDSLDSGWKQLGGGLEGSRFISTTQGEEVENKNYNLKIKNKKNNNAYARGDVGEEPEKKISPEGQLNLPSAEVLKKWEEVKGAKLEGSQLMDLTALENTFGSEIVQKAMEETSIRNNYSEFPQIWYVRFKKILEQMLKEGEGNDRRRVSEETGRYGMGERACKDTSRNGIGRTGDSVAEYRKQGFDYSWLDDTEEMDS